MLRVSHATNLLMTSMQEAFIEIILIVNFIFLIIVAYAFILSGVFGENITKVCVGNDQLAMYDEWLISHEQESSSVYMNMTYHHHRELGFPVLSDSKCFDPHTESILYTHCGGRYITQTMQTYIL
jgi:hypothetical protein